MNCVNNFIDLDLVEFSLNDKVGVIKIKREKQLNALNMELLEKLNTLIDKIADIKELRVLIITGSGERAFVAGADIKEMNSFSIEEAKEFSILGNKLFEKIKNFSKPTIAAVNGIALGGGVELSLACDIRVASKSAKFGLPEVSLGIMPGFGATYNLPKLIGYEKACKLIFSGEMIDATEAFAINLVSTVYEQDLFMENVLELANKIAKNAPLSLVNAKKSMQYSFYSGTDYNEEAENFSKLFTSKGKEKGFYNFLNKERNTIFEDE